MDWDEDEPQKDRQNIDARLAWENLALRKDILGGDLELEELCYVYRGPLQSITFDGDMVVFTVAWCATRAKSKTGLGQWQEWENTSFSVNCACSVPQEVGEGRIRFPIPYIGDATIIPKGSASLDRRVVRPIK